jgi:peptide/nickel transport system permease protein
MGAAVVRTRLAHPAAWALVVVALVVAGPIGLDAARVLDDPVRPALDRRLEPPLHGSVLGTDHLGRDVLSRVVHGTVPTLASALLGLLAAAILGVAGALAAGFPAAGRWQRLPSWIAQGLLAWPGALTALVPVAVLGRGEWALVMAVVLQVWPDLQWTLEREVRALSAQPFVEAARALGYGPLRILTSELLPHLLPSVAILTLLHLRQSVMLVSTLAFLGLGPPPPTPTWGGMVAEGRPYLPDAWWPVVFPVVALSACLWFGGALARGLTARRAGGGSS